MLLLVWVQVIPTSVVKLLSVLPLFKTACECKTYIRLEMFASCSSCCSILSHKASCFHKMWKRVWRMRKKRLAFSWLHSYLPFQVTLRPDIKQHLTEGIYQILDLCMEKDIKFLMAGLPAGVREVFNELYGSYTHYHKAQRQGEDKYTVWMALSLGSRLIQSEEIFLPWKRLLDERIPLLGLRSLNKIQASLHWFEFCTETRHNKNITHKLKQQQLCEGGTSCYNWVSRTNMQCLV